MTISKKALILFAFCTVTLSSFTFSSQDLKVWEVYEVSMSSSSLFENPYTESITPGNEPFVTALFTGLGASYKN